jgi:hypothetical protein
VAMTPGEWASHITRLGERFAPTVRRGLMSGALACLPILHERTRKAQAASSSGAIGAVTTGGYLQRWKSSLTAGAGLGVVLYNQHPAASTIELGRRPGRFPPTRAVEQWARRRLGLSQAEAARAAFPIARAIARRGLKPREVLSGATKQLEKTVEGELMRSLEEELSR